MKNLTGKPDASTLGDHEKEVLAIVAKVKSAPALLIQDEFASLGHDLSLASIYGTLNKLVDLGHLEKDDDIARHYNLPWDEDTGTGGTFRGALARVGKKTGNPLESVTETGNPLESVTASVGKASSTDGGPGPLELKLPFPRQREATEITNVSGSDGGPLPGEMAALQQDRAKDEASKAKAATGTAQQEPSKQ